ncbi:MAG: helix-turn-helix domain-containing protein [Bacteroidales bacterium]|nr:helix-turn-helix domain-containing protein [Bacteroidales bacterium]
MQGFHLSYHRFTAFVLLSFSNLSIREISELVGFKSISSFNSYFKQHFGQKPSEYREINN